MPYIQNYKNTYINLLKKKKKKKKCIYHVEQALI